MKRAIASIAVLLCLVALSARVARAGEDAALAQAREHYEKGTTAFDLGRYLDAAHEYEKAYEVRNDPALLYNIAQAYRLGHDYSSALRSYRSYLRRLPNAPNRAAVEAKIAEMQKAGDAPPPPQAPPPKAPPDVAPPPQPVVTPPPVTPPTPPAASGDDDAHAADRALGVTSTAPPTHRPVYKKWWFWTITVVAVGAVAAGIAVGVTESQKNEPVAGTVHF